MNHDYRRVNAASLRAFVESIYAKHGLGEEDRRIVADVLLAADLRGINSHGVSRLAWYEKWIEKGLINLAPNIRVVHETETTAHVDGDNAMGMLVGTYAMKVAIAKAKRYGSGFVAAGGSNHYGIAGYYSMMAVREEMIGISMTNMIPIVPPTFGAERLLGTNPISFAVPANREPAFVLDMATTAVSGGKLEIAMREERPVAEGLVVDSHGITTTNPKAPWQGGALLPLGGAGEEFGGHKGYGLATLVNALSGALSGSIYGIDPKDAGIFGKEPSAPANVGHFFGAIRVDGFRQKAEVLECMDQMLYRFKHSTPAEGQSRVYVAGEKEHEAEIHRKRNGITLHLETMEQLLAVGQKHGEDCTFLEEAVEA